MKTSRILLLFGGLGLGLIIGGGILWVNQSSLVNSKEIDQKIVAVGSAIPEFELPSLDGNLVSISQFQGKPLVINFWATWCAPCKLEMPLLQRTARLYDGKLSLVSINFEEGYEIISEFARRNQIELIILMDENGAVAQKFRVHAFPVTFFVDGNGIVKSIHLGQLDEELMNKNLELLGIKE